MLKLCSYHCIILQTWHDRSYHTVLALLAPGTLMHTGADLDGIQ